MHNEDEGLRQLLERTAKLFDISKFDINHELSPKQRKQVEQLL